MLAPIDIDLARPPAARWAFSDEQRAAACELVDSYVRDLGGADTFGSMASAYAAGFVSAEYRAELESVADRIDRSLEEVLLANLYYDAIFAVIGCTAFAIDTPQGPLHARNLDWWTEKNQLAKHTCEIRYHGGPTPTRVAGWPGFMGVFSGVAEGRFAITLNAVVSGETPQLATSITLLLREVFDTAKDYDEAVTRLSEGTIASDCLLLVSGTREGEMCVIERTSRRSAIRHPANGLIVVTNDYRAMEVETVERSELQATACARFDRARAQALRHRPATPEACFGILTDPKVKMLITVQHMVMRAATGELHIRLP